MKRLGEILFSPVVVALVILAAVLWAVFVEPDENERRRRASMSPDGQ